jgi:hypothetical protein
MLVIILTTHNIFSLGETKKDLKLERKYLEQNQAEQSKDFTTQ